MTAETTAETAGATTDRPSVLFVCVHNAGRSQMAAAYLSHLSEGRIEVRSAGSAPDNSVNPAAVEAMAEEGIDISANHLMDTTATDTTTHGTGCSVTLNDADSIATTLIEETTHA